MPSVSFGPRPMPSFRRMMVFIDGENIVFGYQKLLDKDHSPKDSVKHLNDVYVWEENSIITPGLHDIIRANYYTYATGSEEKINNIKKEIRSLSYRKNSSSPLPNYLYPIVFKKAKKEAQSKGVDIQMTVDILSQIYLDNIDTVYLIAGDGDYLSIISEIIRMGKQIYLSAFSEGLSPKLEHKVDQFYLLDDVYFQTDQK
jgi:uncharacterized LabA/DUF88 family protein